MKYETTLNISQATLHDLDAIVERIREVGYPDIDLANRQIVIILETGPDQIGADLWDLRDVVGDLETDLAAWLPDPVSLPKPMSLEEDS